MTAFPRGFLWGAATASYQVEGENRASDWWAWEQEPGRIQHGDRSGRGADWWVGQAERDLSLAAQMGHNAHRMSLEWARIEPEPGVYDPEALARYREILGHAAREGLQISLTLQHFSLPRWAAQRGGWAWPALPTLFRAYAARCAREFGGLVELWSTLNEPSVLAHGAYLGRRWPPGLGQWKAYRDALTGMLIAHAAGYEALKESLPSARVGLVLAMPCYDPRRLKRRDRCVAKVHDWIFNGNVLEALRTGVVWPPTSLRPIRIQGLADAFDWLGLNYYGRYRVRFSPRAYKAAFGRHVQDDPIRTASSDWGDVYPEGLTRQLQRLARFGVPLYVTENGVFGSEQAAYLREHVDAVAAALRAGVDVRGYFWWTLVDNFEWAEGWQTPFGLLALDRETQARSPRPVAELLARICREKA